MSTLIHMDSGDSGLRRKDEMLTAVQTASGVARGMTGLNEMRLPNGRGNDQVATPMASVVPLEAPGESPLARVGPVGQCLQAD